MGRNFDFHLLLQILNLLQISTLQRLAQEGCGKHLRSFGGFGQQLIVNEVLHVVVHVSVVLHAKDRRLWDKTGKKVWLDESDSCDRRGFRARQVFC